jgi:FKBP-type peptidyl-prolyl cis-trans isomerase
LIEELVTQRSESTRLSMELAETKAKSAEIETISRQRDALLAALIAVLTTRGRREADTRLEAADLRQRLEAAQAELQRKVSENERLAAQLAAAHKATDAATVMAEGNLAVIDAQIKVLHAAAGDAALASAERRAELLYAGWFDMQPAMPRQMLHLEETR